MVYVNGHTDFFETFVCTRCRPFRLIPLLLPVAKMPHLTVKDGAEIFYKDWGYKEGPAVVFSHGWPLTSDNWENQMFFLANKGYRAIAHDRRGHGRSSQSWEGNDIDTWADDLLQLIEYLDLKDVMLVGHSTGGGEIVRFCGRRELELHSVR